MTNIDSGGQQRKHSLEKYLIHPAVKKAVDSKKQAGHAGAYAVDLTGRPEHKQLFKDILSELVIPSPPTAVDDKHHHPLSAFPESLYLSFIDSRLDAKSSKSEINKKVIDLTRALGQCIKTDSRCSLLMGDLYFQGLVPSGLLHPDDASKNISRAFGLWRYSSSQGNPESQFRFALTFSTFFNPPSLTKDPITLSSHLLSKQSPTYNKHHKKTEETADAELESTSISDVDSFVNHLASDLSYSIGLFYFTLEVLDIGNTNVEKELYTLWMQKQMQQTSELGGNEKEQFVNDIRENQESNSDAVESEPRKFPLYKRDSSAVLFLYAAAQGGHIGAQLALGFRHIYGLGVPKRCSTSATYYLHVAREVAHITSSGVPPVSEIIRLDFDTASPEEGSYYTMKKSIGMQTRVSDLQRHLADTGNPKIQAALGRKYLLGVDGCQQNYHLAVHYFKESALRGYKESLSWLGYLVALGIGVEKNLDLAMQLFLLVLSTSPNDPMAHNGLGYLYFIGTYSVPPNLELAVNHFTLSAAKDFSDAQFNLAALHLTGTGVEQSFRKTLKLLTSAVERGHSGVLHLNGLGTLRDCTTALALFKRVAERHPWVAERLRKAYSLQSVNEIDETAFIYWELAESGIEFIQSNLADLLDGGGQPIATASVFTESFNVIKLLASTMPGIKNKFIVPTALFSLDNKPSMGVNRALAHRYWNLAALQKSSHALIRLGDYAQYGWGITPITDRYTRQSMKYLIDLDDDIINEEDEKFVDTDGHSMDGWGVSRRFHDLYQRRSFHQYDEAYHFYVRASNPQRSPLSSAQPQTSQIIRAVFSIAQMHEGGLGVPQDLQLARRHLERISEIDPEGSTWLVKIAVAFLRIKSFFFYLRKHSLTTTLSTDYRLLFILVNFPLVIVLQLARPFIAASSDHPHSA